MVTASVQHLTISWPTVWVFYRGAVVLSGPVSRVRSKDPELTRRLCGRCSRTTGEIPRWWTEVALEIHWGGSCEPFQKSFTDTSAGQM